MNRIGPNQESKQSLVFSHVLTEQVLNDLQLLLGVKHNVLLRCVFESILTLFEWVERMNHFRENQEEISSE